MNEPERITLTQRRKEMTSNSRGGAAKLQRSKLERISDDMDEERSGGAKSTVAWMIIIIAVSVAAYFGVNNYLDSQKNDTNEDDIVVDIIPTSTPSPQDIIVSKAVLADTLAINGQPEESFTLDDQKIGEESTDTFTIESVLVQPYTTFIRYEIEVAPEAVVDQENTDKTEDVKSGYPMSEVVYSESSIALNLSNISTDNSIFGYEETILVSDSIINNILHSTPEDTNEAYIISLQEEKSFVLHVIEGEEGENAKIVLDILELPRQSEKAVTPTEDKEPLAEEENGIVTTPITNNTDSTSTSFSKGNQSLNTGATGNISTILGYAFDDHSEENPYVFRYEFKISGDYPNVEANLDDTTLTITIKNLARDNITGNGGDGHRDDFYGAKDIKELNVINRNNVSTYTFELAKSLEYRLVTHDTDNRIYLEIKH